jgi:trans-aconitate methyltransferase
MTQRWDPDAYDQHARFVSDLGAPVVDLLEPLAGERVLDLGCGDGSLTERLRRAGCLVVAVDSSPEQVWAALERGLDARITDFRELTFDGEFDAVFSNAALHWVSEADRVIAGVRRALRPGGRFVAEMGGAGCVLSIREALNTALTARGVNPAAADPWYFPTEAEYQRRLEVGGFSVESIQRFPRPTPLPGDLSHWLWIFAQRFLDAVPEDERAAVVEEVKAQLEPELRNTNGVWVVDYVRLRFKARRSG